MSKEQRIFRVALFIAIKTGDVHLTSPPKALASFKLFLLAAIAVTIKRKASFPESRDVRRFCQKIKKAVRVHKLL